MREVWCNTTEPFVYVPMQFKKLYILLFLCYSVSSLPAVLLIYSQLSHESVCVCVCSFFWRWPRRFLIQAESSASLDLTGWYRSLHFRYVISRGSTATAYIPSSFKHLCSIINCFVCFLVLFFGIAIYSSHNSHETCPASLWPLSLRCVFPLPENHQTTSSPITFWADNSHLSLHSDIYFQVCYLGCPSSNRLIDLLLGNTVVNYDCALCGDCSQLQMKQDVIFRLSQTEHAQTGGRSPSSTSRWAVTPDGAAPTCGTRARPLSAAQPAMFYSPPPGHCQPGLSVSPRLCNFIWWNGQYRLQLLRSAVTATRPMASEDAPTAVLIWPSSDCWLLNMHDSAHWNHEHYATRH